MADTNLDWKSWLESVYSTHYKELYKLAKNVIYLGRIHPNHTVVDAGTGLGLVGFNVHKILKGGQVIAFDNNSDCLESCKKTIEKRQISESYKLINSSFEDIQIDDSTADRILTRSSLHCSFDKQKAINELYRILKKRGQIALFEPILYNKTFRIYKYLSPKTKLYEYYKTVEEVVRNDSNDPSTNFTQNTLFENLKNAGFENINIIAIKESDFWIEPENISEGNIFYEGLPHRVSLKEKFLKYMNEEQFEVYYREVEKQLKNKKIHYFMHHLYITAQKSPSFTDVIIQKLRILKFQLTSVMLLRIQYGISDLLRKNINY